MQKLYKKPKNNLGLITTLFVIWKEAEADLVEQEEKSEKSLQRMIELQHKKTEVIGKTTSETVEYALAIQEAQDALDNFSPAGYERSFKRTRKNYW